jgi:glycosyltransferase involved in cell wall biosynthesis
LEIYEPQSWLLEFGRPAWLGNLTFRQRLQRAGKLLQRHGCHQTVLYLCQPEFAPALQLVPHQLSVYHIDDEYSYSPQEKPVGKAEARLIQTVGQVFIHSPAMLEKKGRLNPNTEFVPNGVDYKSYATPVPEPEDLRQIPGPRIGYSGMLKSQMNWPLLLELSGRHPEWSFVFVGGASRSWKSAEILQAFSTRRNVYFLGPKTTRDLARYPQHFQVCMMPYRNDGYTKFIYPLKLHEYLASGRPVVGSPLPTLQKFNSVVFLAETVDEWSVAITQALDDTVSSPSAVESRQSVARAHDWNALVAKIAGQMARGLALRMPEESVVGSPEFSRAMSPVTL